jgi:hypothetical protein
LPSTEEAAGGERGITTIAVAIDDNLRTITLARREARGSAAGDPGALGHRAHGAQRVLQVDRHGTSHEDPAQSRVQVNSVRSMRSVHRPTRRESSRCAAPLLATSTTPATISTQLTAITRGESAG